MNGNRTIWTLIKRFGALHAEPPQPNRNKYPGVISACFRLPLALFVMVGVIVMSTGAKKSTRAFPPQVLGTTPPVVTDPAKLLEYVNQLVTIKGSVSKSKIPRILGVEVHCKDSLRERDFFAVGILRKWEVDKTSQRITTAADVKEPVKDVPIISKSIEQGGYVLYFDLQGTIAEAYAVSDLESKQLNTIKQSQSQRTKRLDKKSNQIQPKMPRYSG